MITNTNCLILENNSLIESLTSHKQPKEASFFVHWLKEAGIRVCLLWLMVCMLLDVVRLRLWLNKNGYHKVNMMWMYSIG